MSSSKPTRDPTSTTCIEDFLLVAYLKIRGHIAIPWVNSDVRDEKDLRVAFDIQGDQQEVESDMNDFYNNERVNVQDYVRSFKDVKSQAYNLKQIYQKRREKP
jgi:hypothetical protein